ncbi:hypothetical protein BOTBODRAFT_437218 [Botryobasidium botryosum FD-172 SS1]|uniref:Uncharacterized protein n=1 Tax=Botryobasidium botryosum (strain FD-172 SS1) TaxID=930990 RepID=A0A067N5I4_BOTB1|nr:hypothetical protein BOTBODRAFT_437218 [Botryobasidium botryosum FD-172 SS1]
MLNPQKKKSQRVHRNISYFLQTAFSALAAACPLDSARPNSVSNSVWEEEAASAHSFITTNSHTHRFSTKRIRAAGRPCASTPKRSPSGRKPIFIQPPRAVSTTLKANCRRASNITSCQRLMESL